MLTRRSLAVAASLIVLVAVSASSAHAIPITFYQITNNGNSATAGQYLAEVTDPGSNQVRFDFYNVPPGFTGSYVDTAVITRIYFDDDGTLASFSLLDEKTGGGVDYSPGTGNLPTWRDIIPPFEATYVFTRESPSSANGINVGESLGILFNLPTSETFADVLNDLSSRDLRLGFHVQSLPGPDGPTEYSERFVNVPETSTIALWCVLFAASGGFAWRRRKREA